MSWRQIRRMDRHFRFLCALACLLVMCVAHASEYHGQVTFGGLPVPGATVTATQGSKTFVTVSGEDGAYAFADLPDGKWKIEIQMSCFVTIDQEVTITSDVAAGKWELKMLSLDEIAAQTKLVKAETKPVVIPVAPTTQAKTVAPKPGDTAPAEAPKPADDSADRAADGFLVNGSVNNAATSQFTLSPAFGNRRNSGKGLYNGGFGVILDNSSFDARPYSLSGLDTPRADYNRVTATVTFGGPLNIPHLWPHGPNFFVGYQWTRNRNDTTLPGLVPTGAQRCEDITVPCVFTPTTQALDLLKFYPLPNVVGNPLYNYQIPVLSNTHQDAMQSRLSRNAGRKDSIYGDFAFQSTRSDGSNLFGFRDTTDVLGINTGINWTHRFNQRLFINSGFRFNRLKVQVTPFFANRINVEGDAGIEVANSTGVQNQAPVDWGPPTLVFASGITPLSDGQSSFNRNRTDALSYSMQWFRGHHNFTFGGDFRRQEFNYFAQQDPRGTLQFTNATTDFSDFLQGLPNTSSINYGNADKYLRQSVYDAYFTDDWRLRPELTINVGARWEYGAPITELSGRLVNLDIASGFTAAVPVLATNPTGTLTGSKYPDSLLRPDRSGVEPRVGLSWRPIPGSSMVVRAGYGVYQDTSVYTATALQLAQQSPFAKSLSLNSTTCPLTLANPFSGCPSTAAPDTFAVDPNFRVGYAQTWQLSVQRDLPGALVGTVTYLGIKGTRGVQEYLPNTYPGTTNPCPTCPTDFTFRASNGNSTREAASIQLRRRLRSGFTASLQYTYSKSIDDDSVLGGQGPVAAGATAQSSTAPSIAQNWLDLNAERGLSTFDQRHLLNAQIQYTSGMGLGGGTLLGGWRGRVLKEWTVSNQIVAGSGLPETPIYFAAVAGTGVTGSIRPDVTGVSINAAAPGRHLNPAAFVAPAIGQWGDARRNSITGPNQFSLNASLSRTFRLDQRLNLDFRVDATNLLNHVVFSDWNTTINSTQFGIPVGTNPMRSLQTTARLRF
jgi:hypothetical protein